MNDLHDETRGGLRSIGSVAAITSKSDQDEDGADDTSDEDDQSANSSVSSVSQHGSSSSCTSIATNYNKAGAIISETQVKTLIKPSAPADHQVEAANEFVMRNKQHQQQQREHEQEQHANESGGGKRISDASSMSSTFKRYKFGLTNHFLTMPEVGDQQDAKFYQKELAKLKTAAAARERRRHKHSISDAEDAPAERVINHANHASNMLQIDLDRVARKPTGGNVAESDDDCDLSVMGPSSPGSGLSSLSSHDDADWTQSQTNHTGGNEPSRRVAGPHNQRRHRASHRGSALGGGGGGGEAMKSSNLNLHLPPAGDAGLDAAKCNSKAAVDDCFLAPGGSFLHHARKLAATSGGGGGGSSGEPAHELVAACHHHVKGEKDLEECASNSLLVRFSSIMYATFLVILGCILHVSELRQKSRNSSDHIYTTIVALLGIFWLLFLQMDLQRYKRYASKYILLESIFNDHRQRAVSGARLSSNSPNSGGLAGLMLDPTSRSTTSSSASLVNDRMSMNTEVIFKKTAYKMYQQRAAALKPLGSSSLATNQLAGHHHHHLNQARLGDSASTSGHSSSSSAAATPTLVPAYKFLHGKMGANFYLKCGMAAFCFGHVIHEGLRFGQQVYFFATANQHCRDSAALVAHLVTPLYSFYQLFMMFKYSNLVINRHKILAKFGLMHIIGTCVTFWFRTILEEAFEDFVHKMDYFKAQNKPVNHYLDPTNSFKNNKLSEAFLQPEPQSWLSSLASLTTSSMMFGGGGGGGGGGGVESIGMPLIQAVITNSTSSSTNNQVAAAAAGHNASLAQTALFALMSSPISATISPQLVRHLPESYHCAQNTLLTTKSMNALPYLYPFTIEYNLLIAATFLSLYFNIGKIGTSSTRACSPTTCYKQTESIVGKPSHHHHHHHYPHHQNHLASSSNGDGGGGAVSKVYLNTLSRNINKQPSFSSASYLGAGNANGSHYGGGGGEFSDNNSSDILHRYSSSELNNMTPASYYRQQAQMSHHKSLNNNNNNSELGENHFGEYKSNFVVNADCHAANKGLFLGFFVLLVTLVTIVIFFVTINKPSHLQLGLKINLIQEATLTSLIFIVTVVGYRQIMRLNKNPYIRHKVTTDDVLMLIPLPFFFIHSLLSFRAETATLYAPSHLTKSLLHNQVNQQQQQQQQQQGQHLDEANTSMAARLMKINESLAASNERLTSGGAASARSRQNANIVRLINLASLTPQATVNQNGTLQQLNSTNPFSTPPHVMQSHQVPPLPTTPPPPPTKTIDHYKLLTIALNLAVMIEVLVQTNFIIDGLRRCSESRYLRFKKPGRELITFAILLNITYWIVATFETKSVEQYKTEIEYYGPLPYMFISHTTLPVMLFYRYHSSVCLAEIWNKAYKSPKKR